MARTLVLNATYEPLAVVPVRRAIVLILNRRAEVVETNGAAWRSEFVELRSPTVIRLYRFVKVPYARRVRLSRRAVFLRDDHSCQYCNHPAENLDHVIPRSQGGAHTWENIVASCRRCNSRKGGRTPRQAGLSLSRNVRAPREHGWLLVATGSQPDPSWDRYL